MIVRREGEHGICRQPEEVCVPSGYLLIIKLKFPTSTVYIIRYRGRDINWLGENVRNSERDMFVYAALLFLENP